MYVNLLSSINPDIESDQPRMSLKFVLRGSGISFPIRNQVSANGVAFYKDIDSEQFFCVEFRNGTKHCMAGDIIHIAHPATQLLAVRSDRAPCAQEYVVSIATKNCLEEFWEINHWLTHNLNGQWYLPLTLSDLPETKTITLPETKTVADFSFSDLEDATLFRLRF